MTAKKKTVNRASGKKTEPKKKAQVKKKATTKKKAKKSAAKKSQKKTTAKSPVPANFRVYTKVSPSKIMQLRTLMDVRDDLADMEKTKYDPSFVPMARAHFSDGGELSDFAKLCKVSVRTIERWTGQHVAFMDAIARGSLEFIDSLCPRIMDWMGKGYSFESFAGEIGRSRSWLYELAREDEVFKLAKEKAEGKSLVKWETLLNAHAAGTLVRVKAEKVVKDAKGLPIIDKSTGSPVVEKEYVSAMGSTEAVKFAMMARFKMYRPDKVDDENSLRSELDDILKAMDEEEMAGNDTKE